MSDADPTVPASPERPVAPDLHGLDPRELLAHGLRGVTFNGASERWEPPTPEELGRILPQYRIERLLGRGGMGAVYKGFQFELERPVAIKILPAEIAADEEFVTRFKCEARTLARLQHPRIITIHDYGQTREGHLYFVMEYIDGTTLREILRGPGLKAEEALLVVSQVCDALCAAHQQGVVHRDVKPENILITRDGYVKLADFGLARPPQEDDEFLTSAPAVMGTPAYMAPEQRAGQADHRSDIYALGVMLHETLTGRRPEGAFEPPSLSAHDVRLDHVVTKALQQAPDLRYQEVSEFKNDLDTIRGNFPAKGRDQAKEAPIGSPAKSLSPKWLIPGTIAALVLAGLSFVFWTLRHRSSASVDKTPMTDVAAASQEKQADLPLSMNSSMADVAGASQEKPFVNTLGMKFVPVPILGGPTAGKRVLFSVWTTRVQDYDVYAKETKCVWPEPGYEQGPTHPAVKVTWRDAKSFCIWLTERERKARRLPADLIYRLPSDYEWSCAVGLGESEDPAAAPGEKNWRINGIFPWGADWPPPAGSGNFAGEELWSAKAAGKHQKMAILAGYNDGFVSTSPVGTFPANRLGLFDLGGNVFQWCEDLFDPTHKDRVLRGSSWRHSQRYTLLASGRFRALSSSTYDDFGFRCVIGLSSP